MVEWAAGFEEYGAEQECEILALSREDVGDGIVTEWHADTVPDVGMIEVAIPGPLVGSSAENVDW
jgi:hypothetical protein